MHMKNILLIVTLLLLAGVKQASAIWHKVPSPTEKNLLCVSFGSKLTAYIGGRDSTLLKTIDGGRTWTRITPKGIDFSVGYSDFVDISFVSSTTGYIVMASSVRPLFTGTIYKTIDGGLNWTLSSSVPVTCTRIFFFDEDNGFQAGSAFFTGKSFSRMSGGVWETPVHLHSSPNSFLYAMDFYDKNTGVAGGSNGLIYRTFNGGKSWDTVQSASPVVITDLKYIDENTIMAVSASLLSVMISTDKGLSWNLYPHTATWDHPLMKSIARSKRDSMIIVGTSAAGGTGIIFTFEGGMPAYPLVYPPHALNDVTMANNDSIAYIVGNNGTILTNYFISGTGLPEQETAPGMLSLYPNPVRNELSLDLPADIKEYSVTVCDITGRQLILLPAGTGRTVDVSGLNSGVYLLRFCSEKMTLTRHFVKE
jgi:photosystem II stability/assembly factor-like uncharacterized protein